MTWAAEYDIADPVLVDSDSSVRQDYFVANPSSDAYASNPRHFVIDREGAFSYIGLNVSPEAMIDALEAALGK